MGVSTHASAGDATTSARGTKPARAPVSTHASAGDATPLDRRTEAEKEFQLTRPRGTRLLVVIVRVDRDVFQLTRPRGTRRHGVRQVRAAAVVSTHASAGDATRRGKHRPLLSAFQLTRPRGTRLAATCRIETSEAVSTHASAGDATVVRKDVFMIALFRYFARRLRFGAFHDAQGC